MKKRLLPLNSKVLFEDVANPESPKWKCLSENKIFVMNFCSQKRKKIYKNNAVVLTQQQTNFIAKKLPKAAYQDCHVKFANLWIRPFNREVLRFNLFFYWKISDRMRLRLLHTLCTLQYKEGCSKNAQLVKQGLLKEARTLVLGGVTTRCTAFPFHGKPRLSLKKRCHGVSLQLFTKWHLK